MSFLAWFHGFWKVKNLKSTVECTAVHTGVLLLLSAARLLCSEIQDRQASIGLKLFSSSVFHLGAVSELNQAVLHSVLCFSTSLPCSFEVTQCSNTAVLKIRKNSLLLPLCG